MKNLKNLIPLAALLQLSSCGLQSGEANQLLSANAHVPQRWACQYYNQNESQSYIDNLMVDITDGDGDGEYRLDVHLYQRRKGKVVHNGHLYKWERDGVKLIHKGKNLFVSPRGTIRLKVKDSVTENGYSTHVGIFTSKKYGIKNLAKLECSPNGEE